jgi:hypothetical protein
VQRPERLGAAPGAHGTAASGGGTELPVATGATPRGMPMGACLGMPRGACLVPRERNACLLAPMPCECTPPPKELLEPLGPWQEETSTMLEITYYPLKKN